MRVSGLFSFPNPVNEYAARATAGLVVVLAVVTIVAGQWWLYAALAIGFALRVAGGPRYSPFGRLSVHVIAPRLGPAKLVPGPPKRFAQTIGLAFSTVALVLFLTGNTVAAQIVLGLLVVAALLESAAGVCLGCIVFGWLQRRGVIPASVCEACAGVNPTPPTLTVPQ
ncbi:DUF4395 domain-containing protein [Tsukamurella tyrosinosolvens]|uniref:DUF4395 domain-containing protein n=1 Tax=Tsukamurella tyrosinosolvens TaxID=57704 RepID=UPI002DD4278C|nr:DUF4395 domain-containing protein [Tsukamurella tyrosinosolvens]MEC4613188.1 DUF4395 domain-containing protein [Tsukamurella tyrosinosolvens]